MTDENEVTYPSTASSVSFAAGFLVFYIVVVLIVLGIFFKIPF